MMPSGLAAWCLGESQQCSYLVLEPVKQHIANGEIAQATENILIVFKTSLQVETSVC